MHELSIAVRVVELAESHAAAAGAARVTAVTLRVGRLACVAAPALRQAFAVAAEGTPAAGADLRIVVVPVTLRCGHCGVTAELSGNLRLACPACGRPGGTVVGGRDLELESLELETAAAATP